MAVVITAVMATFTIGSGLIYLGWWLSKQFAIAASALHMKLDLVEKHLDDKIDAHEKLDVERFNNVQLTLLRMELQAEKSGRIVGPYEVP